MLGKINPENQKLLDRYEMLCKNKGLTKNSTKSICDSDLKLYLRFLGGKPIKDTTNIDVEDFIFYCQSTRGNEACTLARKYTSLNGFYKTMIKKDYLDMKNPLDKIDQIKVRKKVKDYLTEDEIAMVFKHLKEANDMRGLALIHLFYSSGYRISEVVQLNRDSLDFENRKFKVLGKGEKERICIFSKQAKGYILAYLATRKDNLEPLFLSRERNRWNQRTIQRYVKDLMQSLGIKKHITPHSLRHSILTHMRLHGASIEDLQLFAGHSSIATTQGTYTHVGLEDIASKFDKFFSSKEG